MNFFFIIWANPKFYQTLIFLAQYLSKKNYKVYILAKKPKNYQNIIEKINFGRNTKILYAPETPFFLPNFFNFFIFIFFCLFKCFSIKPKHIIFFNKFALFCLPFVRLFKRGKFVYHNFDFEIYKNLKSSKQKALAFLELFLSNFCDYLIFPSFERSQIFKKNSKNKKSFFFEFKNCFPKTYSPQKKNRFKIFLKKKNISNKKIICHLGSIGPGHFIEQIINSAVYIKDEFVVIIAGSPMNKYDEYLQKKIDKLGLSNKVYILKNISNNFWFEILFKSSLGLCFYENVHFSHRYMAGTSQKFNNYILANIPMITNNNKDFSNFKKYYDIFDVVNATNPKNIASKINSLLTNKTRYCKIKKNLKTSFLHDLNFEKQYEKSYETFL
jgi:glycosyltransferase involved in cell wall biosynthesis